MEPSVRYTLFKDVLRRSKAKCAEAILDDNCYKATADAFGYLSEIKARRRSGTISASIYNVSVITLHPGGSILCHVRIQNNTGSFFLFAGEKTFKNKQSSLPYIASSQVDFWGLIHVSKRHDLGAMALL